MEQNTASALTTKLIFQQIFHLDVDKVSVCLIPYGKSRSAPTVNISADSGDTLGLGQHNNLLFDLPIVTSLKYPIQSLTASPGGAD